MCGRVTKDKGSVPSCESCTLKPFRKLSETSENLGAGFAFQAGSKMAADRLSLLPPLILFRPRDGGQLLSLQIPTTKLTALPV